MQRPKRLAGHRLGLRSEPPICGQLDAIAVAGRATPTQGFLSVLGLGPTVVVPFGPATCQLPKTSLSSTLALYKMRQTDEVFAEFERELFFQRFLCGALMLPTRFVVGWVEELY